MRKLICAHLALCLVFITSTGFADDWAQWRGPKGDGISRETGWDPASLEPKANIAWNKNVGSGHSSFAIRDGRAYTMGNENDEDMVYCLDAKTGKEIWTFSYACPKGNYSGPRSTPVLDGDNLYTLSRDGQVHCLGADDGNLKWRRNLVKSEKLSIPKWGLASSARVAGELVLFNAGTYGIALNKDSGETAWRSPPPQSSYASPVVYDAGSEKRVAMFSAKSVNAVELRSGKRLWSFPWQTRFDVNAADPIISNGRMFISSGYGTGGCLLDISGAEPEPVWQNKKMANHFNSCVLIDGHLYGIDGNTGRGAVVCIEFATGEEKWRHGRGFEGLMAADGKLILMDNKGFLRISEVTPIEYREIANAQVLTDRSAKNWTVPVLADGYIYCRNSKGEVVCVNMQ